MSARDAILNRIRASLGTGADDQARRRGVEARLARPPRGVIPQRGQVAPKERVTLFCRMAEQANATVQRVKDTSGVPRAVTTYLRDRNLPASVRMGADRRLKRLAWPKHKTLEVKHGRADPDDEVGVSYAAAGIAETGTAMLYSGADNPTTINFLPAHHIVIVDAKDIDGDYESAFARIRRAYGRSAMPRTVNMITGPSRSGDIEQKLLLGAHGPRGLHLIVVGG